MRTAYETSGNKRNLDRFDLEAMRDGQATSHFHREFAMDRPDTRAQAKRGVVRGKEGAKRRNGLFSLSVSV